jgi:LysM repeat protein
VPAAAGAYYRIQNGDTLDGVARRLGTSIARLLALNPGIEPTALRVGQRVRVPN